MNWGSLKSKVLSRIHDNRLADKVPDWFNEVQLEMVSAAQWRHLEDEVTIPTTAPYSTGTASATAGASTVTFSGATIPAGAAGQLLSMGGFYYRIATRDSASQVTIDGTVVATVSAVTYQIVFYALALPDNFSEPRIFNVTLQAGGGVSQLQHLTEKDAFDMDADESRTLGQPMAFRFWAGALRLFPPPDAAYNVKVFYQREPAEMDTDSDDEDTIDWPDDMQYGILQGVFAVGFEHIDDTLAQAARGRFETALTDAVTRNNRKPGHGNGRLKRWDRGGPSGRIGYRLPEPIG